MRIPAILLAAGKSERMGRLKQLIEFQGKTFLQHSIDNLLGSGIDEVIVVTGHQGQVIREAIGSNRVKIVHNPLYEIGMSTSIKTGIAALPPGCEAFLLALADQPLVGRDTIAALLKEYDNNARPLILVPTFGGRKGHPVVISAALIPEILRMDDTIGLKQVIQRHTSSALLFPVDTDSVVTDFDYPADLERIAPSQN